MRKILLSSSTLDTFIEWKSEGVTNGRIAGILGIHPNTLSNWINKGKEIALRIEQDPENYQSIFNKNDLVVGIKNEYLYKLYIENNKQHHIACAKSEIRAIKTGNILVHLNVVRLLNATRDIPFIDPKEFIKSPKPPMLPTPDNGSQPVEFTKDQDIIDFLNEEKNV